MATRQLRSLSLQEYKYPVEVKYEPPAQEYRLDNFIFHDTNLFNLAFNGVALSQEYWRRPE